MQLKMTMMQTGMIAKVKWGVRAMDTQVLIDCRERRQCRCLNAQEHRFVAPMSVTAAAAQAGLSFLRTLLLPSAATREDSEQPPPDFLLPSPRVEVEVEGEVGARHQG